MTNCPECGHTVHDGRCGHTPNSDGGLMLVGPCWCTHTSRRSLWGWAMFVLTVAAVTCAIAALLVIADDATSADVTGCSAQPGKIVRQADGTGVHVQRLPITCRGAWTVNEAVLWSPTTGDWLSGKWSYGGDRTVHGTGSRTLGAFNRAYSHCAWWKLRVTLNGHVTYGPVTKLCT